MNSFYVKEKRRTILSVVNRIHSLDIRLCCSIRNGINQEKNTRIIGCICWMMREKARTGQNSTGTASICTKTSTKTSPPRNRQKKNKIWFKKIKKLHVHKQLIIDLESVNYVLTKTFKKHTSICLCSKNLHKTY